MERCREEKEKGHVKDVAQSHFHFCLGVFTKMRVSQTAITIFKNNMRNIMKDIGLHHDNLAVNCILIDP
jgi:hypothetical protein